MACAVLRGKISQSRSCCDAEKHDLWHSPCGVTQVMIFSIKARPWVWYCFKTTVLQSLLGPSWLWWNNWFVCLFNHLFASANTNSSANFQSRIRRWSKKVAFPIYFPLKPIAADFFFILILSGLHMRDFSLTLRPLRPRCSLCLAAAANHVCWWSDTNTNTANYKCHTMSHVKLIMWITLMCVCITRMGFDGVPVRFGVNKWLKKTPVRRRDT